MRPIVARDLMTTEVLTVRADMTVSELATFLDENEITGAPVEDEDGRIVGVVSVVDVARSDSDRADRTAWAAVGSDSYVHDWNHSIGDGIRIYRAGDDRLRVRDIMSSSIHSVREEATVPEIVDKMLNFHLHRLLVIEGDSLVGIISTHDLLGLLVDEG